MRFTPVIFASAVAAAGYYADPVASSSSPAAGQWGNGGYGGDWKPSTTSSSSSAKGGYGGAWPKTTSSSSAVWSQGAWPHKSKSTTVYKTDCWTVTTSSTTKTWTSVKAIPTWCDEDDEWDGEKGSWKPKSSTPASPVKPTGGAKGSDVPYCPAVTETCTVTVTATKPAGGVPTGGESKPTYPAAPVKSSDVDSWPQGGSYTAKPVTSSKVYSPVMATANAAAQNGMAGAAALVAAAAYLL